MKKITIITGHYGSGKTNFAVNLAISLAQKGEKITVADLDIVNPYFRSADFKELFRSFNISLAVSAYAKSNLDIPALSFDAESFIRDGEHLIVDVGGDDAGAIALGRYSEQLTAAEEQLSVNMLYVINQYRYLTRKPEEALELMYEIEAAARLRHTGIINNSHLCDETTAETVLNSISFADEVSEKSGLPIVYTTVPLGISAIVKNPFPVHIYVKKIWEN
ncbi:MAG: cobalamin biosynthesis protein CobQ [Oscillospiraceae bacterium]|nr:cobalamin biosynthesis protein CobQ [Oscillospiraceae bacterium]